MKKITIAFCAASFAMFSCNNAEVKVNTTDSSSATTKKDEPVKRPSPEEEMKAWMAFATPGDMHKMLAKDDGVWISEITTWMAPDSPAVKTTGSTTNTMILGGRYQQSVHKATMFGMPFEGIATVGYDNAKKKFVNTWVDNFGTGIMLMEGTWDAASKSLTSTGKCTDPLTGKDCEMREVLTFVDDNTQKMEMYSKKSWEYKEFKNMEIVLKRKK